MAITDADIAAFATEVLTQFKEAQRRDNATRNARDKLVAPGLADAVGALLYTAAHESAAEIARQAGPDTTLTERRTSYRYTSGIKGPTASLTLIVAGPAHLWIAQHEGGQLASVQGYPWGSVATKGKRFSTGTKIEPQAEGVLITGSKGMVQWVDQMRPAYRTSS